MPTRLRKTRKMRGSRTHGWGIRGHRRRAGPAGRAGIYDSKWNPQHERRPPKRGFKSIYEEPRCINVQELDELFTAGVIGQEVDLSELGYDKLLGKGRIEHPLKVKVKQFSEAAKRKIEAAGGTIIKI